MDIPDTMKAQLIDDWENVTKNQQVKKKRYLPFFYLVIMNLTPL